MKILTEINGTEITYSSSERFWNSIYKSAVSMVNRKLVTETNTYQAIIVLSAKETWNLYQMKV